MGITDPSLTERFSLIIFSSSQKFTMPGEDCSSKTSVKRYSITSVAIVDCDTEGEQAAGLETDGESDNICAFLAAKVCRGIYCTLMGSLVILAILSVVAIVEGVVGQLGLQSK